MAGLDVNTVRTGIIERMSMAPQDAGAEVNFSKSPAVNMDIWKFFELVGHLISIKETWDAAHDKIRYTEETGGILEILNDECIAFELEERAPGTFGQNQPGTGVKMRKPIRLGHEDDLANPQYKIVVLQQWYDNVVGFGCWARSLTEMNRRLDWFEDLMTSYGWYLEMQGYKFRYEGLGPKQMRIVSGGGQYFGRQLRYWVRTVKTFRIPEKRLDDLIIELSIANQ
jgi:hypothetical protein